MSCFGNYKNFVLSSHFDCSYSFPEDKWSLPIKEIEDQAKNFPEPENWGLHNPRYEFNGLESVGNTLIFPMLWTFVELEASDSIIYQFALSILAVVALPLSLIGSLFKLIGEADNPKGAQRSWAILCMLQIADLLIEFAGPSFTSFTGLSEAFDLFNAPVQNTIQAKEEFLDLFTREVCQERGITLERFKAIDQEYEAASSDDEASAAGSEEDEEEPVEPSGKTSQGVELALGERYVLQRVQEVRSLIGVITSTESSPYEEEDIRAIIGEEPDTLAAFEGLLRMRSATSTFIELFTRDVCAEQGVSGERFREISQPGEASSERKESAAESKESKGELVERKDEVLPASAARGSSPDQEEEPTDDEWYALRRVKKMRDLVSDICGAGIDGSTEEEGQIRGMLEESSETLSAFEEFLVKYKALNAFACRIKPTVETYNATIAQMSRA
ncbi:MAG: hypothetical protein HYX48_04800 [Chlamydiales bacterium]|nr:hypothetical protein [Chlamydiales bacterium]